MAEDRLKTLHGKAERCPPPTNPSLIGGEVRRREDAMEARQGPARAEGLGGVQGRRGQTGCGEVSRVGSGFVLGWERGDGGGCGGGGSRACTSIEVHLNRATSPGLGQKVTRSSCEVPSTGRTYALSCPRRAAVSWCATTRSALESACARRDVGACVFCRDERSADAGVHGRGGCTPASSTTATSEERVRPAAPATAGRAMAPTVDATP
ncbi:hypothetical protein T492DRAFT_978436 [Pavlovales sp. CCMP2436]|nr:hypothetical protein T492DRAFT_978436 [Pavlovales sp. CCMP2436]|mmetsp:Transcript_5247/g.13681  ORF Transcript_5247/g.13681 Transcript_5247/m.13681 type:complete len:209 (-) Transcript_5247:30-656(-)|eukprot:CAMPEP_0180000154 /NCGR_PEP_ID=MMETSP0984-20121128/9670_1 /TAXON_ID=483367 /ORGANISM="non described non described, Strain CCMP 2436" /LENGTH=208 /DNA_ID=CAMNT_0021920099 /DNA_START=235 /DNA_END=861 /DNA_ORIENTATION=+